MTPQAKRSSLILIRLISITLFVLSLSQLAFCTQSSCMSAFQCLFSGWMALIMGGPMLLWLANPLLFVSWVTIVRFQKLSTILSLLTLLLMLSFLYFKTIYNHNDEWESQIIQYRTGYWLWGLSAFVITIGNIWLVSSGIFSRITSIIILVAVAIITTVGLNRKKNISVTVSGCKFSYDYKGNLDTLDEQYIVANRNWAVCYCNLYRLHKRPDVENMIRLLYNRYGRPRKAAGAHGMRADTIARYSDKIFGK